MTLVSTVNTKIGCGYHQLGKGGGADGGGVDGFGVDGGADGGGSGGADGGGSGGADGGGSGGADGGEQRRRSEQRPRLSEVFKRNRQHGNVWMRIRMERHPHIRMQDTHDDGLSTGRHRQWYLHSRLQNLDGSLWLDDRTRRSSTAYSGDELLSRGSGSDVPGSNAHCGMHNNGPRTIIILFNWREFE
ncbi:hypothetical protein FHG87_009383 [Trinorchestia longiramus]|nr:hypothetical protein FHG87_009383 [Trinorchestia longiramus]